MELEFWDSKIMSVEGDHRFNFTKVRLGPLTIIAGETGSGKSEFFKPLRELKKNLELGLQMKDCLEWDQEKLKQVGQALAPTIIPGVATSKVLSEAMLRLGLKLERKSAGLLHVGPMVASLLVSNVNQLVYLENPEAFLHPECIVALTDLIGEAIERGVRVILETQSELLLLGIQCLVAEGKLPANEVMVHWFSCKEDGTTDVSSAYLDGEGAYGGWPETLSKVSLATINRYLKATERKWREGV